MQHIQYPTCVRSYTHTVHISGFQVQVTTAYRQVWYWPWNGKCGSSPDGLIINLNCNFCADLCRFAGKSSLHRQLACLVKILKYSSIWPQCKFTCKYDQICIVFPLAENFKKFLPLMMILMTVVVMVSPQALQINEFTGLDFCQDLDISPVPPGVV